MFYSCNIVPQGYIDKIMNLQYKMAAKVTKKVNGTISQNECHEEYIVHGKFHAFFKNTQLLHFVAQTFQSKVSIFYETFNQSLI